MTKTFLRTYPLSLLVAAAIWTLSLINIPETPLDDVTLMDKWVHMAMYFVLTMTIGHEYFHSHDGKRADGTSPAPWTVKAMALWAGLLPALMGGLVEIVQATCTGGRRSGDWLDFLADAIGSAFGLCACILASKLLSKK